MALALALLLPGLGATPLDDPGEGQHAEIARELLLGGDWVTLRLNGVRYFDKPPLLYWLVAGSFARFGVGESAARLVPAAGAVVAAAGTALLGARLLGPAGGVAAAAALCASALFVVFGRYVRPETLFVAAIQWGFAGLLLGLLAPAHTRRRWLWLVAGCAGLGLASLAKDPLGLVGPLGSLAVALALAGRLRPASWRLPWPGIALLGVVGFGWYAAAAMASPGFVWYTVVDNHVLNALGQRRFPDQDVPLTTLEFLAVTGLGAFPWVIGAGAELVRLARRRAWRDATETPWVALSVWVVGLIAFFAVVRFKLPHYALPVYPAIALLAARAWRSAGRPLMAAHLVCFAVLAAGAALVAAGDGHAFMERVFSTADVYTRKELVAGDGLPLPAWTDLASRVMWAGIACAVGAAVLGWAWIARAPRLGLVAVLATMLAIMPLATSGAGLVASGRTVAEIARRLDRTMLPGDLLVHEGPIENSGALEFYSGRRPVLLDAHRSVLGMGATYPEASGMFWTFGDLARAWLGDRRVFLVSLLGPGQSAVAALPPERLHVVARVDGRWLYSNLPPR